VRTGLEGAAENVHVDMMNVLWDAVGRIRFTAGMVEKAQDFAMSRRHKGCAEYIDNL
jgi:hypothetical protein